MNAKAPFLALVGEFPPPLRLHLFGTGTRGPGSNQLCYPDYDLPNMTLVVKYTNTIQYKLGLLNLMLMLVLTLTMMMLTFNLKKVIKNNKIFLCQQNAKTWYYNQ